MTKKVKSEVKVTASKQLEEKVKEELKQKDKSIAKVLEDNDENS